MNHLSLSVVHPFPGSVKKKTLLDLQESTTEFTESTEILERSDRIPEY